MIHRILLIVTFFSYGIAPVAYAHQPVMDMAPRWEEGYGFQIRHERYGSSKLMDGHSEIANPLGLERHVKKTWLEGVYTFERAVRVTFKLPYIEQKRVKNIGGVGVRQKSSGLGDLVVGVPLKHYINQGGGTQNFSFTPSLRVPTGSAAGDFPISDGSLDLGLSFSHGYESAKYYTLIDLFYWINKKGKHGMREGNELGLDINLGYHSFHDDATNSGMFIMWDVTARHHHDPNAAILTTASGGKRIHTGPVFVLYKDNMMFRSEYKHLIYEKTSQASNSRGNAFNISIGITF